MGPCPWRHTVCESVGERWCDGAGGLLTLGFRSYRCLHGIARMCWRGMETGPIFDCRETAMGPCRWRHTACESVGERWCDGAGGLLTLGFRPPMLARMLAWVGRNLIFDCRETEMGPRNSHLETLKENADSRRFSLKDRDRFGGLPVK